MQPHGTRPANQLSCLRAIADEQVLVDAAPNVVGILRQRNFFFPVVDGHLFDSTVLEAFRDGHPKPGMPVLLGPNSDEGLLLASAMLSQQPGLTLAERVPERFGAAKAVDILPLYDISWYPGIAAVKNNRAIAEVGSDMAFYRSAYNFAMHRAFSQSEPLFVYHFEFKHPLSPGAPHGTEIPFIFDTQGNANDHKPAPTALMQQYWKRFAATGTPTASGGPAWPAIDAADMQYMALRDDATPASSETGWLELYDVGDWRPCCVTKLELVDDWNAILPPDHFPPLVPWP